MSRALLIVDVHPSPLDPDPVFGEEPYCFRVKPVFGNEYAGGEDFGGVILVNPSENRVGVAANCLGMARGDRAVTR